MFIATFITKRLPLGLFVCAFATCSLIRIGSAQTNVPTPKLSQPYTMREDFQGDSLGQWASYPPVQDNGYEPSLAPATDDDAPGGRSLMRVIRPNVKAPLRFGFIKRIPVVLNDEATLRFSYHIKAPATEAALEIGLAGENGKLYTKNLPASRNVWVNLDTGIAEFRDATGNPPASGAGIEAVYLVANFAQADPDTTYRFFIDDVVFTATREMRFRVSTPATQSIEPWSALLSARGYRAGEMIAIEASAPTRLKQVKCTVRASGGKVVASEKLYDDGTHGDRRANDGIWTNSSIHSVNTADETGLWTALLEGTEAQGLQVSTTIRLIVHPPKGSSHPRLYFSAPDRQRLIERSQNPKLAKLWEHLITNAKNTRATGELAHGGAVFELLDKEYLLPSLLAYFDVLNRARFRIAYNAFEAYITGSTAARDAAKAAMLDVAAWPRWQPPWFNAKGQHTYYPAGLLAAEVAFGYDLLYDQLSETERNLVRRALIEKVIAPTFKEYVLDNRIMANTSNWIAHTVGGALIATASIAADLQDSKSIEQIEIYLHGLLLKLEDHMEASFLADGSYGEGISYHEFDMETLGPALHALRSVFGIDYWKQTHVLGSIKYPLYTLAQPTSGSLDMGDTHAPAGHGIPALVYESKDPVVRWYYEHFDRPSLSKFIFYDDSVVPRPPTPPQYPTSRIFPDKGNAIFRSSWDKDALILLYRAGPNFNHHHNDQGSFLINAFGEVLVTEAGWSDYYKDPYYATFFTQAVGHSTILVDGNPESQTIPDSLQFKALANYPRITDAITSEFYDGLGSELSSVYQNRLARHVRRIVFIKPHYFVVYDDLEVNGNPAQFDFLLHLPDRARIKIENLTGTYNGEKASLAVRSFGPNDTKLGVENGRVPYHIFSARTPAEIPAQPAYLTFKTVNALKAAQFVTALVPAKNESAVETLIKQMTEIAGENLKGIRVERGKETDLVMFRVGGENQTVGQGEWQSDAAALAISQSANNLKQFAVHHARSLRRGEQVLFSSESPANLAANFLENEVEVACNTDTATRINLYVGKRPVGLLLNHKRVPGGDFSFNRADGTISLTIPEGQNDLKIKFR